MKSVIQLLCSYWRLALTSEEHMQFRVYCTGVVNPEEGEPNPHIFITPHLRDVSQPLLVKKTVYLNKASGRILHKSCVNVLNKKSEVTSTVQSFRGHFKSLMLFLPDNFLSLVLNI